MQVGIDVAGVAGGRARAGLYNYLDQLTRSLKPRLGRQTLYCNPADQRWAAAAFPSRRVRAIRPPQRFYRLWRRYAAFNRSDVYLHTLFSDIGPITAGVNVYCVPDVIPLAIDYPIPRFLKACTDYYQQAVRDADEIIVWAAHAKQDLLTRVGGDAERVHIVPLAAGPEYVPLPRGAVAEVLARHGLVSGGYVLCVSTLDVRKNHVSLVAAFASLLRADPALPHRLVFVGARSVGHERVFEEVRKQRLGDRFVHLGFAGDLPALYNGAAAFAFPSRYEGFGLPPLEAMACGTPVVCSNATALPEVVGDAALMFSPDDVDTLAGHLRLLLTDKAAAADYTTRGLRRAAEFSWERTAEGYLRVFKRAMARRGRA